MWDYAGYAKAQKRRGQFDAHAETKGKYGTLHVTIGAPEHDMKRKKPSILQHEKVQQRASQDRPAKRPKARQPQPAARQNAHKQERPQQQPARQSPAARRPLQQERSHEAKPASVLHQQASNAVARLLDGDAKRRGETGGPLRR